jgi:hypothetical protein
MHPPPLEILWFPDRPTLTSHFFSNNSIVLTASVYSVRNPSTSCQVANRTGHDSGNFQLTSPIEVSRQDTSRPPSCNLLYLESRVAMTASGIHRAYAYARKN